METSLQPEPTDALCAQCQVRFPKEALWPVEDRAFCEPCLRDLGEKVRIFYRELGANANLPGALLLGTAAAALGALVWWGVTAYTGWQIGILAIGVAWFVGKAVVRGSGFRRGPALQALAVALTLAAIVLAELTIASQNLRPAAVPLDELFVRWVRSYAAAPIGIFIIGFAVYQAWLIPRLPKVS